MPGLRRRRARRAFAPRSSSPATPSRPGRAASSLPAPMGGALGEAALVDYFVRIASAVSAARDDPGCARLPRRRARARARAADRSAAPRTSRLVKLEAGPVEMSDWIERLGARVRDLGRRRRRLPARLRAHRRGGHHPGRRPGRLRSSASTRPRREGEQRSRRSASRDPADARLRDAALDRPLQRLREARPRPAWRSRQRRRSARPPTRSATCPGDAARAASGRVAARSRAVFVSTDPLQGVEGLREPQRLSHQLSTLLAAEIVSGRIGVGQAFPSSEEIVTRFGVSRTVARETVQALAMLGIVNVQHGKRTEVLPARGVGHPQLDRAGGAAPRGQGRAAAARPRTSSAC